MMSKPLSKFWLAACMAFMLHTSVYNQFEASPVEISNQKIRYQGKTYYVHTVKPGHTLYSICKAYAITQNDLATANPGITLNPLSVGLALRIPVPELPVPATNEAESRPDYSDHNFIYHTVQPKENPYFLHQKYNVPLEEIYKYNPGSEESIQMGQLIKIPKKHLYEKNYIQPAISQEKIIRYLVKQGDTLYRIAETFNLTLEDILNANEELRWGLKAGQIINIPVATEILSVPTNIPDTVFMVSSYPRLTRYQCDSIAAQNKIRPAIKVALLLPFYTKENIAFDTMGVADTLSEYGRTKPKTIRGRAATEFYEGMLLAFDSLKNTRHNISVFVYDTEADTNKVRKIIKDLEIIEPDLIIGPFAPKNVEIVSVYSFERKIPFIPPLVTNDSGLLDNPFLFRTIPSDAVLFEQYTNYLSLLTHENVILIVKKNLKYKEETKLFKKLLLEKLTVNSHSDSLSFSEIFLDDSLQIHLGNVLSPEKTNNVIVFSTYEPDVITALARLHFLMRDYPIKVYGFPAWQKFDNLRIDVVHELQVSLYSPFFIDYSDNNVKSFIKKCRDELQSEPYKTTSKGNGINYTYLGYDLAMYFIQALFKYENNFCDCTEYYDIPLLLATYNYKRNFPQQNFMNTSVSFVNYRKDYTVTKIRTGKIE